MCHGHGGRRWSRNVESEETEEDDEPSFLNDETAEDVEILTDGGDEEE
jgi:hypothetical protein